jgi:thioesterase domain-containing protein
MASQRSPRLLIPAPISLCRIAVQRLAAVVDDAARRFPLTATQQGLLFHRSQALQDVAQNNYRALRIYKAKPYEGCVGLFCAREEPEEFTEAKQKAWRMLVPSLELYDVPGDHLSMVEEPHVQELARQLAEAMWSDARTPSTDG